MNLMGSGVLVVTFFLSIFCNPSFAYESEIEAYGYQSSLELPTAAPSIVVADEIRIKKFNEALNTLGIPLEPAPDFSDYVHAGEANQTEVEKNLPYIDPENGLLRYLSFANGNLQLFRDFFKAMISLDYLEYQQSLSLTNPSNDSAPLLRRLSAVSVQTQAAAALPLTGLKILIDPGHMGGEAWDAHTGKFVVNPATGVKVSEGELNLWTALLTAKKLQALGATVLLTRETLGPVSKEDPKNFDVSPYLNNYFYNSIDDWMAPYLSRYTTEELKKNIANQPEVKAAYTETKKMQQFYIAGADLDARAKMIDSFQPDITIDIHFDGNDSSKLQNSVQFLEAFVPGGFGKIETGSRKSKAQALKHALEVRRWNQSVTLADYVTQSMSDALKIPRLAVPKFLSSVRVRDGVYARNLFITRRALTGLVVYLECLHYDHVNEHKGLSIRDQNGSYGDIRFQYPKRLDTIASGIEQGVLAYFQNAF